MIKNVVLLFFCVLVALHYSGAQTCVPEVSTCNPGDECECLNGGECVGNVTCECLPGFDGDFCGIALCNQTCVNGNCTGFNNCTCEEGWTGPQCDEEENTITSTDDGTAEETCGGQICEAANPCAEGVCRREPGEQPFCTYPFKANGTECEFQLDSECYRGQCKGGVCTADFTSKCEIDAGASLPLPLVVLSLVAVVYYY